MSTYLARIIARPATGALPLGTGTTRVLFHTESAVTSTNDACTRTIVAADLNRTQLRDLLAVLLAEYRTQGGSDL